MPTSRNCGKETRFPQRRMGGRAVEGTGLENRQAREGLVGSNPTPSANRRIKSNSFIALNANLSNRTLKFDTDCSGFRLFHRPNRRPLAVVSGRIAGDLAKGLVTGDRHNFVSGTPCFGQPTRRRLPQTVRRTPRRQPRLVTPISELVAEAVAGERLALRCHQKR